MDIVTAARRGFSQTFDWTGRATRAEYWLFILLSAVCYVASLYATASLESPLPVLLWALLFVVPTLGVEARRFHDTDRGAAFVLLNLVPYVGAIAVLVFMCQRGTPGFNRYGPPDPATAARAHQKLATGYERVGADDLAVEHSGYALLWAKAADIDVGPYLFDLAEHRDRLGDDRFRRRLIGVLNDPEPVLRDVERAYPTPDAPDPEAHSEANA